MRPIFRWLLLTVWGLAFYVGGSKLRSMMGSSSDGPGFSSPNPVATNVSWPAAPAFSVVPVAGKTTGFPLTITDPRATLTSHPQVKIECQYNAARMRRSQKEAWRNLTVNELDDLNNIEDTLVANVALSKTIVANGKPTVVLWCEPNDTWWSAQWQVSGTATITGFGPDSGVSWSTTQPLLASFVRPQTFTPSLHTLKAGVSYVAKLQRPIEAATPEPIHSINYSREKSTAWLDITPGQTLTGQERTQLHLRAVPRAGLKWPVEGRNIYPRWNTRWANGETENIFNKNGDAIDLYPSRISRDKSDLLTVSVEAGNRVTARILVLPAPTPTPIPTPTPEPSPTPVTLPSGRTYGVDFHIGRGMYGDSTDILQASQPNQPENKVKAEAWMYYASGRTKYSVNINSLRVVFRAVDSQRRPLGSFLTENDDSDSTVRMNYRVPLRTGQGLFWVEVFDSSNRLIVKSTIEKIDIKAVEAWAEYGLWEQTDKADEWKRPVYLYTGIRSAISKQITPHINVVARLSTPSKDSWLETSGGLTNDASYPNPSSAPLTVIQYARWTPESSFQLSEHQVVVQMKK